MDEEELEYWAVVSAVFEGKPIDSIASRASIDYVASTSMEASINNKVGLKLSYYYRSYVTNLSNTL